MKLLHALVTVAVVAVSMEGKAQVVSGWVNTGETLQTDAPAHNFAFEVDSVDFRPDLTRIYGRFIGTPHVAINVKHILLASSNNKRYVADDTDGFDLNKYFQFEENPTFNVEIDFGPMAPTEGFSIKFVSANGGISYSYIHKS